MTSYILITSFIVLLINNTCILAWGGNDKVLLKDIDVLTLYNGKMTKGSRSAPVPQLECVGGGTAPCNVFKPRVVQCYNRGSDGADVQWECKTDMDNAYRFGEVEVSCEGYNYPDDPYILKGSCGLRYNVDYTMEGQQQKRNQHDYYGDSHSSNYYGSSNNYDNYYKKSSKSWNFADIIVLCAVGLMIYAFYTTCVSSRRHVGDESNSTTNEDYPSGGGGGGGYGWHNPSAPPPPGSDGGGGGGGTYGFHPDYTSGASCGRNRSNYQSRSAFGGGGSSGSGAGGFWTGAATGGLLGYMFGNRNNGNRYSGGGWTGGARGYGGGGGFSGGGFSGGGFSGGSSSSTGTRSASGFGGTSRR